MKYRKFGPHLCAFSTLLLCGALTLRAEFSVLVNGATKNFVYRAPITIGDTQVQGGPHNSFPMIFNSTTNATLQADLKTVGNGGKVRSSSGYDIVFDTGGGTEILKHEIEKYTASSGEYIAWVKVDLTGSDQTIYIYYSSTEISADTQHVTDVWDTNYKGVWHLKEEAAGINSGTETLRPNGAGDETYLPYHSPGTGFHWEKVDEETADDWNTYVTSNLINYTRDLYALPDSSVSMGVINKVTVYFKPGTWSAGGYSKAVIKTHSAVYEGSEELETVPYWGSLRSYEWTNNPYTGSAWT